ncbi:hypothetical protein Cgig2_025075 [Carnegiea gigantea]|uniref:NAC domain-containing protein n=1 Tax=Carnegiea gigantea TaxID=171969 RepID=A0A9Q1JQR4_9CARY|nr:hypothetical protein Cgig2_025075 [Carnegiea gigantea]
MVMGEKDLLAQLSLPPGFRFYPTDEELLVQYLCRKVAGHHFSLQLIVEIDLYKFDPWVLPSKAMFGEKEWYFFSPRDRKYPNGSRPNRVAGSGYWKATGTDKVITTQGKRVGIKKALVFYVGKAPKGSKTDWIMHEYRLTEPTRRMGSSKLDDWVLCRIYKKSFSSSKPTLNSREHSTGGSSSSSLSHLDEVLEPLPQIGDHRSFGLPRMNSLKNGGQQQEDNKFSRLQHLGSGSFDWSVLAGLTYEVGATSGFTQPQCQVNNVGNDMFAPSMAPFSHSEAPHVENNKLGNSVIMDEEVQSGIRTQRVGSSNPVYYDPNSSVFTQTNPNSVEPFGVSYQRQLPRCGYGFGFRQ